MARVTIDKGAWVVVALDGERVFGEVVDYTSDDEVPNRKWIKVQLKFDLMNRKLMDLIYSFSSDELARADELSVFDAEQGLNYYTRWVAEVHDEEHREEQVQPEPPESTSDTIRPSLTPTTTGGIGRMLRHLEETISSETTHPRIRPFPDTDNSEGEVSRRPESEVQRPRVTSFESGVELPLDPKNFNITLTGGDIKTVSNIAEKNPSLVFDVLDQAVDQLGHQVFRYLDKSIKTILVDLKIDHVSTHEPRVINQEELFLFKKEGQTAKMFYVGDKYWFVLNNSSNIPEIPSYTLITIDPEQLSEFIIEPLDITSDEKHAIKKALGSIDASLENYNPSLPLPVIYVSKETSDKITNIMLGEHWVNVITLCIIEGCDINTSKLDLKTFETYPAIENLAKARGNLAELGIG